MNRRESLSHKRLMQMYKDMRLIRYFEEAVEASFKQGLIHGTTHLCIGQEATAVGAGAALHRDDKFTSTHRGHGHSIALGADLGKMMAELFGKETGYCKGKGGSMHIADVATGNLGANGIVGGSIPIAVGSALTAQMKKLDYVTLCFFGDGATNEGSFHEALNLAAIWKLPVVFICENNGYGMSSAIQDMVAIKELSQRAEAYGFPGVTIDGNDVRDVYETVSSSVQRARLGDGPTLIEASNKNLSFAEQKRIQSEQRRKERQINEIETKIEHQETRINELEIEMTQPDILQDHEKLLELAEEVNTLKKSTEQLMEKWTTLQI